MIIIVALVGLTLFITNYTQAAVVGCFAAVEGQFDLLKKVMVGASTGWCSESYPFR